MGNKDYLGDSVYVDCDHGVIRLYTDNGLGRSNEIYLEPEVMAGLKRYEERVVAEAKNGKDNA